MIFLGKLYRHSHVSLACGLIDFGLFALLFKKLEVSIYLSYLLAFSVATLCGYLSHNFYTFKYCVINRRSSFLFFLQVSSVLVIGYFFIDIYILIGLSPLMAKLSQMCSTFFLNFIFANIVVFKK
jgi:putative flippase GtrA